jgi:hypothetical protein
MSLARVIEEDDIEAMRKYLESPKGNANFTINIKGKILPLLGWAKSEQMAQLLIDKGADLAEPFLHQATANRIEVMKVILKKILLLFLIRI